MCIIQLLFILSFVYWHYVNTETIRYSKLTTLTCINLSCYLCILLQTAVICILLLRLILYSAYCYVMTSSISTLMDLWNTK